MKLVTAILALALTAFGFVMPAQASTESNCAFLLVPVSTTADGTLATPTLIGCYSTYAAALSAGSDGAIQLSSSTTPSSLTDTSLAAATSLSASSNVLIGTEWNLGGYGGSSNSYFATATCSSTQSWSLSYVGDTWNDAFQSGKGFGGCNTNKKFADSNFGGDVATCTPNCTDYGLLDNRVSSLKWKP